MSYSDFLIRKEHKFLRNIYSFEDLQKSKNLKDLENYHVAFQKSLGVVIFMKYGLKNSITYDDIYHDDLKEFCQKHCPAYLHDVIGLIDEIKQTKVKKNTLKFQNLLFKFMHLHMMR